MSDQTDPYHYWAFISYSHHDRRVARWLRDSLRKAKAPKNLRSEVTDKSDRLEAIFLDASEAEAAPKLGDKLRSALDQSRYLIVICSPFATASDYVTDEIRYFKSLGREDRIICLIASGVPNATDGGNPAIEAFPSSLREYADGTPLPASDRPLGIALGDETKAEKEAALTLILSRIHEVTPDSWKKRQRGRALRQVLALTAAVLVLASAGAAYWLGYEQTWITYSKEFARRNGIWEPVDKIPASVASLRDYSFRFERKGWFGNPESVRKVNQAGNCTETGFRSIINQPLGDKCGSVARACEARFEYLADGKTIAREEMVSQFGHVIETLTYDVPTVGAFKEAGFGCSRSRSGIEYIRVSRYESGPLAGLDRKIEFLKDVSGQRQARPNISGEFGREWVRDPEGRILESWTLGANGERALNEDGYSGVRTEISADGTLETFTYLAADSQPTITAQGITARRNTLDEAGNVIRQDNLDADGNFASSSRGWITQILERDETGRETGGYYLDENGDRTYGSSGSASWSKEYDENGYLSKQNSFDLAGKLSASPKVSAEIRWTKSPTGENLSRNYFDHDGRAVNLQGQSGTSGYHSLELTLDDVGNIVSAVFRDTDGKPAMTRDNDPRTGLLRKFGERNEILEVTTLGKELKPVVTAKNVYNENGLVTKRAYFDADGSPTQSSMADQTFGDLREYDDFGYLSKSTLIDAQGHTMMGNDGYAILRRTNDIYGNILNERYFNENDEPILTEGLYHEYRQERDRNGLKRSFCYFGLEGEPATSFAETHCVDVVLDIYGRVVERRYRDVNGNAVNDDNGTARITYAYDIRGNEAARRFFDASGERTRLSWGPSGYFRYYDRYGNEIERIFVDENDQPLALPDSQGGYASWRKTYDEFGREITIRYFDPAGQPAPLKQENSVNEKSYSVRTFYDVAGNVIREEYLDVEGNLSKESVASAIDYTYNENKQMTSRRFRNWNGVLVRALGTGRAGEDIFYDALGREILRRSIGEDGKAVNRADHGWSEQRTNYDDVGKATKHCFSLEEEELPCA